jgi:uncharacterized protein Yka (UPF0111/DUF47 family)
MSKSIRLIQLLAPVAIASLVGCGEVTKIQECTAVIDAVNKGQDVFKIDADEKKMEEQAKKIEDFEKTVGEVKITDPELKKHVDEYRDMVKEMAKVLRDVGKGDVATVEKRVDKIVEQESQVVNKINGYCRRQ